MFKIGTEFFFSVSIANGGWNIGIPMTSYLLILFVFQTCFYLLQALHCIDHHLLVVTVFHPGGSEGKASACGARDPGSIPGLGRSPGERNGNPLQYSCLENPMDRGAWWATVHRVAKSWT